jgi:hypothetical protein
MLTVRQRSQQVRILAAPAEPITKSLECGDLCFKSGSAAGHCQGFCQQIGFVSDNSTTIRAD